MPKRPPSESLAITFFIWTDIALLTFSKRDWVVLVNMDSENPVGEADFPARETDGGPVVV